MGSDYLKESLQNCFKGFKQDKKEPTWQWAEKNVNIPIITGSPKPGPINTGIMPWMRGILDYYDDPTITHIDIMKSARVGGTLLSIITVLESIARSPSPVLWVAPTTTFVERFSRQELQPFIKDCKPIYEKAYKDRSNFQTKHMLFRDATLGLIGTGSPSNLAGVQCRVLVLDEIDKFAPAKDGEAPPAQLAEVRTKQFQFTKKIVSNSTPTTEEGDAYQRFIKSSQGYFYVPCPCCKIKQRLTFFKEEVPVNFDEELNYTEETRTELTGQFVFSHCKREDGTYDMERVVSDTKYECASCNALIDNEDLNWMMRNGVWHHHNPEALKRGHASFHIWQAYSPFVRWGEVSKEFILAKGSAAKMQNLYNSTLGKVFIKTASSFSISDIDALIRQSPLYYMRQLPFKPEFILMTLDVQQSCFWYVVRAYSMLEDSLETCSALIDCGQLFNWDEVKYIAGLKPDKNNKYNSYSFGGEEYTVNAGFIDSGFDAKRHHKVYEFCQENNIFSPSKGSHSAFSGMKGMRVRTSPLYDYGIDLIMYEDSLFKSVLYYDIIKNKERKFWLPIDTPLDYKEQLTSEKTVAKKQSNGSTKLEWIVEGTKGNHMADCEKNLLLFHDKIEDTFNQYRNAA